MTDIRSLVTTGWGADARLVAKANPPANLTAGKAYWPLAFGIDCAPANPVLYVLLAADDLNLAAFQTSLFTVEGFPQ